MSGRELHWWHEDDCGVATRQSLLVAELCRRRSKYQEIAVFEHRLLGRVLVLDGVVQTTTADEFVYHEMLAHVPLSAWPGEESVDRSVLIVGGGDGGTLREVLRREGIGRVVMVEIDPEVVEVSYEYLGIGGDLRDPRVELVYEDGAVFVARDEHRARPFDVVLVDSTDPLGGPGDRLFTAEFVAGLEACLAPGGMVVWQMGVPFYERQKLAQGVAVMRRHFAAVEVYRTAVPTYLGGDMAFAIATRRPGTSALPRWRYAGRWYDPAVHEASFVLPPTWREWIDAPATPDRAAR